MRSASRDDCWCVRERSVRRESQVSGWELAELAPSRPSDPLVQPWVYIAQYKIKTLWDLGRKFGVKEWFKNWKNMMSKWKMIKWKMSPWKDCWNKYEYVGSYIRQELCFLYHEECGNWLWSGAGWETMFWLNMFEGGMWWRLEEL